jgi:hypothetical protein
VFLGFSVEFEVGSADQFFFTAGGLFKEHNIDIVEGGEFFLDRPDDLFVPDTNPLSWVKVHDEKVGSGGWIHYPKNGLNAGQNSNHLARTMVIQGSGRGETRVIVTAETTAVPGWRNFAARTAACGEGSAVARVGWGAI